MELQGSDLSNWRQIDSGNLLDSSVPKSSWTDNTLTSCQKRLWLSAYIIMWYLISVTLTLYNKWLFSVYDFHFPLTTTAYHFALKMPMARIALVVFGMAPFSWTGHNAAIWFRIIPTGAATSLDVALSNLSFLYITVTYYTIVKSSVPLWILAFSIWLKLQRPRAVMFFIVVIITGGIALASYEAPDSLVEGNRTAVPQPFAMLSSEITDSNGDAIDMASGTTRDVESASPGGRALQWWCAVMLRGQVSYIVQVDASSTDSCSEELLGAIRRRLSSEDTNEAMVTHEDVSRSLSKGIGLSLVLGASLCGGFRWACTQKLLSSLQEKSITVRDEATAAYRGDALTVRDEATAAYRGDTLTVRDEATAANRGDAPPSLPTMHPLTLVYAFTPAAISILVPLALVIEFEELRRYVRYRSSGTNVGSPVDDSVAQWWRMGSVLTLASVGAVLGFVLLLAELRVVQLSSGLSLSIAGIFKEVLTVAASTFLLHDQLTSYNVVGLLLCLLGILLYTILMHADESKTSVKQPHVLPESKPMTPGWPMAPE